MFISFDFWNTIGLPNPLYRKYLNNFLIDNFGEESVDTYTDLKRKLNKIAEQTGECTTAYNNCQNLIKILDSDMDTDYLLSFFQHAALLHPPIIDDSLFDVLNKMNQIYGITSNTDFICGDTLLQIINNRINLKSVVFSDQFGKAKPHNDIFHQTYVNFSTISTINKSDVIHIGDSIPCDIEGSQKYGFKSIFVNNPSETLLKLKELI